MRWLLFVALGLAGCGSSKQAEPAAGAGAATGKASSMSTFNLAGDAPVVVEFAVPAGWSADAMSKPDAPVWKADGARHLALVAISPNGSDDEIRMRKAIRMQYDDGAGAERTELPGGRVWMVRPEGDNIHARMFVPYPGGVVMGVAILAADAAAKLPEAKAAFETLAIAGS